MSSSALTFGSGTGDDMTWTGAINFVASQAPTLVMGWWKPTTLTATRKLWSAAAAGVSGAEIDATTSELRLKSDNATTDGQWTTSGVGLTANQWQFIAVLFSWNNTGTAAAWRVWSGTISSAPVECTVSSATAPVGNFTASADIYIGNAGTGTVAFQGDIAAVTAMRGGNLMQFGLAALGAITNDEADFNYRRLVIPYWLGSSQVSSSTPASNHDVNQPVMFVPASVIGAYNANSLTVLTPRVPTLNGATLSQDRCPRPYIGTVTRKELPASYL